MDMLTQGGIERMKHAADTTHTARGPESRVVSVSPAGAAANSKGQAKTTRL
jgi:hypothetical protein